MSAPDLQPGLPTICRDANRLLLAVEQCVRNFPRYHKYQVGADLRHQAMQVARLAQRAWRDRAQQAEHVGRLVWAVDEVKLTLQLAKTVQAFASFAQFEACATLAVQLGKQSGGWHRQLVTSQRASTGTPSKGQADHRQKPRPADIPPFAAAARPDSLSSPPTSHAAPAAQGVQA